jgi:hypothetical protein
MDTQQGENLPILFYFILFYFILFYFIFLLSYPYFIEKGVIAKRTRPVAAGGRVSVK